MRIGLAVALLLLAALAAWMLLGSEPADDDLGLPGERTEDSSTPPSERRGGSPTLPVDPSTSAPTAPSRAPGTPAPPAKGKAALTVVPKPWGGASLPADLRIDLERVGARLPTHPLPRPSEDGSRLRYEDLPEGTYRVRLFGDSLLDATADVTLRDRSDETLEIDLLPGGAAHARVVTYAGEPPAQATFALRDAKGKAVAARFEGRAEGAPTTSPKSGERVTMPAEVVVSGLRPGTYTLRATSPAEEFDEATFEVRAGERVEVALKVRR